MPIDYRYPYCSAQPPAKNCLYFSETFIPYSTGWSFGSLLCGPIPTAVNFGAPNDCGTALQTQYDINTGGWGSDSAFAVNGLQVWTLAPAQPTDWQFLNIDLGLFEPINFVYQECDLTKQCYYVDIPAIGNFAVTNIKVNNVYGSNINPACGILDPSFPYLIKGIFGAQSIYTIIQGGGSTYIKIDNCYTANHPKSIDVLFVGSFNFSKC